jgi:hypothetical protein
MGNLRMAGMRYTLSAVIPGRRVSVEPGMTTERLLRPLCSTTAP